MRVVGFNVAFARNGQDRKLPICVVVEVLDSWGATKLWSEPIDLVHAEALVKAMAALCREVRDEQKEKEWTDR